MEFRVLGPLEVSNAAAQRIVTGRQRTLLALLLVDAEQVVSADRLVDELWGGRPPPSAANMLHGSVSRLRKGLEHGAGGATIESRGRGYVLHVVPQDLDAGRFEKHVRDGERRLREGDLGGAAEDFTRALALWRGPAYADVAPTPAIEAEIARLEELRLVATELRIEAELGLGRDGSIVPELEALVSEHPYRERLRGELMLALYRAGRQPDALEVYQAGRVRLADELGIEPGPRLRELERAILSQDPALDPPVADRRPRQRERRSLRRLWIAVIAAALAVAAAVIGVFALADEDVAMPAPVRVLPHSLTVVDPSSDSVIASFGIGGWPRAIASGGGFLWAAQTGDDAILRVDPVTRLVVDRSFATTPLDVAWSDGAMWAANGNSFDGPDPPGGGTVERYDLATGELTSSRVGPAVPGNAEQTVIASGAVGVWAGNNDRARVYRLDPSSGAIAATVPGDVQVVGLALGEGSVWAVDATNDLVLRIDPRTARVVARIAVGDAPRHLAVGEGAVWVAAEFPSSGVWRIDPATNRVVAHIRVAPRANWITVGGGSVWVTSNNRGRPGPGSLTRIDPSTNTVTTRIDLGFSPEDVIVANGLVWVVVGPM